jgi:uncharacterized membrane protein
MVRYEPNPKTPDRYFNLYTGDYYIPKEPPSGFCLEMVILLSDKPIFEKIYIAFFELAFPADLKVGLLWLAANILAIYLPVLNETPIRAMLFLPGILFIPGYYLLAALFPKNIDIDFIERITLSLGLSIAVVPLIALGLNFTPLGIRLDPILIAVTVFTLVMILIAHYRRTLLPSQERFRVPFVDIAGTLRKGIFSKGNSRVDRLLTVVITLAMLSAVLATVYVITVPKEGEKFTEFFILGEKQKAADYPDRISVGQQYPLYIGVGNHEYRTVTYTIETWRMNREFENVTNTSRILAMDLLWRQSLTLADNETTRIPYNLSFEKTGYNRVEFLLFNETVPGPEVSSGDRINASYQDIHLWVSIRNG